MNTFDNKLLSQADSFHRQRASETSEAPLQELRFLSSLL